MHLSRRQFVQAATLAGFAGAMSPLARASRAAAPARDPRPTPAATPKKILILGGTGFIGPVIVEAAKARGHTLTLFNRGKTEERKGGMFPDLEKLHGDRDPKVGEGLKELEGDRTWDAVVDTSGYVPRIVSASANLLAKRVQHYIFISTISVYPEDLAPNSDESAKLQTIADPTREDIEDDTYGPLKALCEQAAEKALPGRVAHVRPGVIVGPGDPSDRFTYWPVRVSKGGKVLAPGKPADPIQYIDVRDLADWVIRLIETNTTGTFNAVGPSTDKDHPFTIGALLESCKRVSKGDATFVWADEATLAQHKVRPWVDMPLWVGADAGMTSIANARAVKAGLTFRPCDDTVKATLDWWPTEVANRAKALAAAQAQAEKDGKPAPKPRDPARLRIGLAPQREQEVLTALAAPSPPASHQDPDKK